jgi:hypothetical protein
MRLAILGLMLAMAALAEGVAGKWKISSSGGGNSSESSCEFTMKGTEIGGTCTTSRGKVVPVKGMVKGEEVNWVIQSEYDGGPLTISYKGKLVSAKKITGTLRVDEVGVDGEFEATRLAN